MLQVAFESNPSIRLISSSDFRCPDVSPVITTVCAFPSQSTFAPNASVIARTGTSVLPFKIIGCV